MDQIITEFEVAYNARQTQYDLTTDDLLVRASHITSAYELAIKTTPLFAPCDISWVGVNISDDTLELTCEVSFPVGSMVATETEEPVEVTADIQDYFNKTIGIRIPLIFIGKTQDEVVDFITDDVADSDATTEMPSDGDSGISSDRRQLMQAKNPSGVLH